MRHLTMAILVIGWAALAQAEVPGSTMPRLSVRTFDAAGIGSSDLARAAAKADSILRGAGLELVWEDCTLAVSTACSRPPAHGEVIVRFVIAGPAGHKRDAVLGLAFVDPTSTHAVLATVYVDEVARVARKARIDARHLLGRAMAHEIGHLLLNTNSHAESGLMRANWERSELRRDRASDWGFAESEGDRMRRNLQTAAR